MPDAPAKRTWLGRGGHQKHQLGWQAERYAAQRLTALGYRIVERNVVTRAGEIDIVAEHGKFLCFIEVRSRREDSALRPRETITAKKRRRMVRSAESYMRSKHLLDRSYRFDAAEVIFDDKQRVKGFDVTEAINTPRRS